MEQTTQSDDTVSQIALRVALQTMKERCLALQKRLNFVEEENQQLRERFGNDASPANGGAPCTGGGAAENFQLRLQLGDLQRQKTQLSEHISMVSNENRKLWSRLSQMAKDQDKHSPLRRENDCALTNDEQLETAVTSPRYNGAGANQNLIRSKTFTQHSPNPNLRHKLISNDVISDDNCADMSLEEVALEVYHHAARADATECADVELGFGYMNVTEDGAVGGTNDADFSVEAKSYIEGLQEMRREAMKQQQELTKVVVAVQNRIASKPCPECAKKTQKPETADKSLETDDSLSEVKFDSTHKINGQKQIDPPLQQVYDYELAAEAATGRTHLNLIQEKIAADEADKTCPMCGCIYNSLVSFDAFRQHVEMHFIDDSICDVEKSFELVAHTVGQI